MSSINLTFINRSNDVNNTQVVLFQKNVSTDYDSPMVAWRVIENCGIGSSHPFDYPLSFQVAARDNNGNYTPLLDANHGQAFALVKAESGHMLQHSGNSLSPKEVELHNQLEEGSITARICKDQLLLGIQHGVSPKDKAVFQFLNTLWVGAVSEIQQGDIIPSSFLLPISKEFNLNGVRSADLVMYSRGRERESQVLEFKLENVVYV